MKIESVINRYAMETRRLFDVADRRLAESHFLAGDEYTIADIAAFTWLGALYRGLPMARRAGFCRCRTMRTSAAG